MVLRRLLLLAGLGGASLVCVALLHMRESAAGSHHFHFLRWNLFLAWIPFLCAGLAYELSAAHRRPAVLRAFVLPLFALWLVFLPNAPYITTDFIHLKRWDTTPLWFDAVMIASFAGTGLLLGLTSVLLAQAIVSRWAGAVAGWLFAFAALGIASVGVYFGRTDHRWNSWDVLARPSSLTGELWMKIRFPLDHIPALVDTAAFAGFLIITYLILSVVGRRVPRLPV